MAEWNKNKVDPSEINKGQEFINGDNLARDELNAIVNNSFYASEKAQRAEQLAESAVRGNGTLVTIGGQVQGEWSADFAESERQKSETDGAIVHKNEIDGLKGELLWENPNPTTTFGTQDITLSSSNYDYLEIYWFGSTSNLRSCVSIFDKNSNNYGFIMSWASTHTNGAISYVRNANVGRPDGDFTKVHFEVAWEAQGTTSEFAQNNACIPYKIIGYKRS